MPTRTNTHHDLAQHLSRALDQSEEAFLDALMGVVEQNGWSKIARQTGVDRVSLHRYGNGDRKPKFDALIKLAGACGVKFHLVPL